MISKDPAHFCLLAFKKAISCCKAERNELNIGLQKYRPGRSEPILMGGANLLKPALQLMNVYRLRIDEINWVGSVLGYYRFKSSAIAENCSNAASSSSAISSASTSGSGRFADKIHGMGKG